MGCICVGISDESGGQVRIFPPKTMKIGTILYMNVVPAMSSPFRDHITEDHIKQAIIYYKSGMHNLG